MTNHRFHWPATIGLTLAALCLLAACGNGAPDGLVSDPATLDFGEVPFRDVLHRTLTLRNASRRSIYIHAVTPNCGCVKISDFLRSIEPGETRELRVVLDSRSLPRVPLKGKVLDVATKPESARLLIPIEANIVATHDFSPILLELGTLDAEGREKRHRIEFRPEAGVKLVVRKVDATPPVLQAEIERLEGGTDVVVGIRSDAPAGTGRLRGRLKIHVDLTLASGTQRTRVEHVPVEGEWP